MADDAITVEEEQLDGLIKELKRRVKCGRLGLELVLLQLEQITGTSRKSHEPHGHETYPLAEKRCYWFFKWYTKLGFDLAVPIPHIPDDEFERRAKKYQALFYRPPTLAVTYEDFMAHVGQGNHWTVKDEEERAKIVWEPTDTGYWFWAEVKPSCPHMGTSWNDLTKAHHLLSLEEYVMVWWAWKTEKNKQLDVSTWSWLRSRFGQSALAVYEYGGEVDVDRYHDPESLAISYGNEGGRAAEVVTG